MYLGTRQTFPLVPRNTIRCEVVQTCQIDLSLSASWSVPILASAKFNLYPWQLEESWASIFDQEENVRRETERITYSLDSTTI